MRVPREHRAPAQGGEQCWFEWGSAGQGPSLLLLHATGFHARCWDRVVDALPANVHVIAPDLRGHGRSVKPADIRDWTQTAGDVAQLLHGLSLNSVVGVGHSKGGWCLGWVAAHGPQPIARGVMVDPVILPQDSYENPLFPPDAPVSDHPVARRRERWQSWEAMATHFSTRAPYSGWQRAVLDDYCRHGLVPAPDGDGLVLACPAAVEASAYMGSMKSNPHEWLSQIDCPMRVVRAKQGERQGLMDFSNSPTWPQLADAIPNGRDEQWTDCTHFIPMEAPERLAALIMEEWRLAA